MKRGWKKALTERGQEILNGARFDATLDLEADAFLRDLLNRHPESESKIGCGVSHFVVRRNQWNKRTFWLIRMDGTATDFSFLACITAPSPRSEFAKACREAAHPSVLAFKCALLNVAAPPLCPITGDQLTRENCHIDHAPPWTFEALVQEFAREFETLAGMVAPTADGDTITRFADQAVADRFRAFHDGRATLRGVAARVNLSELRRRKA